MASYFLPPDSIGDAALSPPEIVALLKESLRDLPVPPFGKWVPLQPIVFSPQLMARICHGAEMLYTLSTRVVLASGSSWSERAETLDHPRELLPLLTDVEDEALFHIGYMARPDVTLGPSGPMFLEQNVSGATGGWVETSAFRSAWGLVYPRIRKWPYFNSDPIAARADFLENLSRQFGGGARIAIVGSMRDYPKALTPRYFLMGLDALRALGLDAVYLDEFSLGKLVDNRQRPFDIVVADLTAMEWIAHGLSFDKLREFADTAGTIVPAQSCSLLGNKRLLALLSQESIGMDEQEKAFVRSAIPWTRSFYQTKGNMRSSLVRLCLQDQESLVLKKEVSMKSADVVIGRFASKDAWRAAIERAVVSGTWVAQQYIEPQPGLIRMVDQTQNSVADKQVRMIVSPCLVGGRANGCYIRCTTHETPSVIWYGSQEAMENIAVAPTGD